MPLYDYHCQDCGGFRSWQSMSESGVDVACPECHELAGRLVSAPSLALMPNNNRIANARNEKSADQPELVTRTAKEQGGGGITAMPMAAVIAMPDIIMRATAIATAVPG